MEKKKTDKEVIELVRYHLGAIDLICRLLFLAAATPGFLLKNESIGHLAAIIYRSKERTIDALAGKEGK